MRSITVAAKAVTHASMSAIPSDITVSSSSIGPYDKPLMIRLNDLRVDMFCVKDQARDPKWAEGFKRAEDKIRDMTAMVSDPDFRTSPMLCVPSETFTKLACVTSASAAFNLVQQCNDPYTRLVLERAGHDKVNVRIEYVL